MVISITEIVNHITEKLGGRYRSGDILYASWISQFDQTPFEVKVLVLPNGKLKPISSNQPHAKSTTKIISYNDEDAERLTFSIGEYSSVDLSRTPKYPWR
jgi:hypothetical protein